MMMVAMVVFLFLSCGSDDDNTETSTGNINLTVNGKQLVRINLGMFQYNSNGQLIKIKALDDNSGSTEISYWYESNRIVVSPWDKIYKLSNGRIVECEYTIYVALESDFVVDVKETYEYDKNGYLIKVIRPGYDFTEGEKNTATYNLTWQNGNLIKVSSSVYGDDIWEEHVINYTSYPNTIPFVYSNINCFAFYLSWQGYYGQKCKNLPASDTVTRYNNGSPTSIIERTTYTYDYTFEDGLVTKVVKKWTNNGVPSSKVYEFEWY